MTDIPEDFFDVMREAIDIAWSARSLDHKKLSVRIYRALLSERSRQIERDAKIADEYQRLSWSVLECDCSQEATAYGILATAIRAQEPK